MNVVTIYYADTPTYIYKYIRGIGTYMHYVGTITVVMIIL